MASVNNTLASKQPKILLVDDREDNLLSIEAILEPDGYQFFRAYSGHQALKILLNEFDFAMILMDVKMPVLNGFETATLIHERERLRYIPIIFITANNYGDENIFKGYRAGGIDYIFKPINPEVLRAKVAVFMDIYRKNALLHEQEQELVVKNKSLEKEIIELKAAEEKTRQFNIKLQNEISSLTSILAGSKLSIDHLEFEQSDLNGLLKNLLTEIDDWLKEKTATILIEPLPAIRISRILVRPLFQHLIQNALHHSKKDVKPIVKIRSEIGVPAAISVAKNSDNNNYCRIIIEDNGVGFDENDTAKLFGAGEIIHNNGTQHAPYKGLALCKKIMEKHNGFIAANSKIDEGTTIIVSFPLE